MDGSVNAVTRLFVHVTPVQEAEHAVECVVVVVDESDQFFRRRLCVSVWVRKSDNAPVSLSTSPALGRRGKIRKRRRWRVSMGQILWKCYAGKMCVI